MGKEWLASPHVSSGGNPDNSQSLPIVRKRTLASDQRIRRPNVFFLCFYRSMPQGPYAATHPRAVAAIDRFIIYRMNSFLGFTIGHEELHQDLRSTSAEGHQGAGEDLSRHSRGLHHEHKHSTRNKSPNG